MPETTAWHEVVHIPDLAWQGKKDLRVLPGARAAGHHVLITRDREHRGPAPVRDHRPAEDPAIALLAALMADFWTSLAPAAARSRLASPTVCLARSSYKRPTSRSVVTEASSASFASSSSRV